MSQSMDHNWLGVRFVLQVHFKDKFVLFYFIVKTNILMGHAEYPGHVL